MKKIICAFVFVFSVLAMLANDNASKMLQYQKSKQGILFFYIKEIDITVTVNGYTIHIVGNVDYSVWTGKTKINATIYITGNGVNLSLPFNYNGKLSLTTIMVNRSEMPGDDEITDFIISCIDFNTMTIIYPDGQ